MADGRTLFTLVVVIIPLIAAFGLGFAPLHPFLRSWGGTNHAKVLLGIFIAAWFLSWIAVAGFVAEVLYSIASFYFDTTFGQVAGATRTTVQAYAWNVLVEIWLRQLLAWLMPSKCFAIDSMSCQLADGVARLGLLGISPAIVAIFPALFSFLIARRIITRHIRRQVQVLDV